MDGAEAERRVARWLEARGRRVLCRNFRVRGGEIDLVALDGETVCIVEVRARSPGALVSPLESVGPDKRRRLERAAALWIERRGLFGRALRFDVAAVEGERIEYVEGAW